MRTNHHEKRASKRIPAFARFALAFITFGAAGVGGTFVSGTANADCVTASSPSVVDCDGIQHGEMSPSTNGAVDGHGGNVDTHGVEDFTSERLSDGSGSYVGGQAVEDWDGTQGEFCGATAPFSVPRC